MAGIKYGDCSPQVVALQNDLNKKLGYGLEVTGEMDDATAEAVNNLKSRLGVKHSSGDVDSATLALIKDASLKRKCVVVNGKTACVTEAQMKILKSKAGTRAGDAVRVYVNMANEAMLLWGAHDKTKKANWFWSTAVEAATGATFPSRQTMLAAVKAAQGMESQARACTLNKTDLSSRAAPIRTAFAAMDQYREELFGGGAELVKNLETIRDGCQVTLTISAAVATGGASWQVQVGVSAGVAAYDAVLKEVDTASKIKKYNIAKGVTNVFMAAVIDGTVGLLMKGGKLGPFLDKVADKAVKGAGSSILKKYAIKWVNGGAQNMIEKGIKGLQGLADPKKKFTIDDFIDAAIKAFVEGAALKTLGPVCEKYGAKAGRHFSLDDFKGLGKNINLDKAGEAAVQQAIDKIGKKALEGLLAKRDPKTPAGKFDADVRKAILADASIKRAVMKASKKKK